MCGDIVDVGHERFGTVKIKEYEVGCCLSGFEKEGCFLMRGGLV